MKISDLDTPSLLIDQDILTENLRSMQEYANRHQDVYKRQGVDMMCDHLIPHIFIIFQILHHQAAHDRIV